jgi:hypothetical protein
MWVSTRAKDVAAIRLLVASAPGSLHAGYTGLK